MKRWGKPICLILALCLLCPAYAAPAPAEAAYRGRPSEPFTLTYPSYESGLIRRAVNMPSTYRSPSATPARDQGQNELCWAFAALGAVEANMRKNGAAEPDLSELHMGYATSDRNGNISHGFYREPGEGGHRSIAAAYLIRGALNGIVDELEDPYERYLTELIPSARALSVTREKEVSLTVQNILFLSGERKSDISREKLKEAVITYGAVGCSMYWDGRLVSQRDDSTLYYNARSHAYFYSGSAGVNHDVLLVGWDDHFPAASFNSARRPRGSGAWLVKNSWGGDWGDDGYFWISYEDTRAPLYAYAVDGVTAHDSDATVYEYEPHGFGGTVWYPGNAAIYGANVFTAGAGESLKEVRLFLPTPNTAMSIYIQSGYTGKLNIHTAQNILLREKMTWPGWYTYTLDHPLPLHDGQFAVIVRLDAQDGDAALSMGYDSGGFGGWSSSVTRNVSYISENGSSYWEARSDGNLNIKAVTAPSAPNLHTASAWAHDAVNALYRHGLLPAPLQGSYAEKITRGEFCALTVAVYETYMGEAIAARADFPDDGGNEDVRKMAGLGVVGGSGGLFNPHGTFSRAQAAVFFVNLLDAMGHGLPQAEADFDDTASIPHWALVQVGQAQAAGLLTGSGGNYNPGATFSRQESVMLILKLWEYLMA